MKLENIFLIPILDNYILLAPEKPLTILLNRQAVKVIYNSFFNNTISKNNEINNICNYLKTGIDKYNPLNINFNPLFLGFITTRKCNSICLYCDFKQSSEKIDLEKAGIALEWYFAYLKEHKNDAANIQFFGGEPLEAFEILELLVHKARYLSGKLNIPVNFDISTNGQASTEKIQFLADYFQSVTLSFDGFSDIQNLYRPRKDNKDSFYFVNHAAKIIGQSSTDLNIRCCITSKSVKQMVEMAEFFTDSYYSTSINFETVQNNLLSEKKNIFPPDPFIFSTEFIQTRHRMEQLGVPVIYSSDYTSDTQLSSCPAGKDALIVYPDGGIYSCYLEKQQLENSDISLKAGIVSKEELTLDFENLKTIKSTFLKKPLCDKCFCKFSCAGGCHIHLQRYRGNLDNTDFCIQTRLITAYSILKSLGKDSLMLEILKSREQIETIAFLSDDRLQCYKEC